MFMYQPLAFAVCNEIFDGKRNSLIVDSALALYYVIRGVVQFLTTDKCIDFKQLTYSCM